MKNDQVQRISASRIGSQFWHILELNETIKIHSSDCYLKYWCGVMIYARFPL